MRKAAPAQPTRSFFPGKHRQPGAPALCSTRLRAPDRKPESMFGLLAFTLATKCPDTRERQQKQVRRQRVWICHDKEHTRALDMSFSPTSLIQQFGKGKHGRKRNHRRRGDQLRQAEEGAGQRTGERHERGPRRSKGSRKPDQERGREAQETKKKLVTSHLDHSPNMLRDT